MKQSVEKPRQAASILLQAAHKHNVLVWAIATKLPLCLELENASEFVYKDRHQSFVNHAVSTISECYLMDARSVAESIRIAFITRREIALGNHYYKGECELHPLFNMSTSDNVLAKQLKELICA